MTKEIPGRGTVNVHTFSDCCILEDWFVCCSLLISC